MKHVLLRPTRLVQTAFCVWCVLGSAMMAPATSSANPTDGAHVSTTEGTGTTPTSCSLRINSWFATADLRVTPPDSNATCDATNHHPICSAAQPVPATIWAPNHQFVPVVIMGLSDPDGDAVTLTVTTVTQDEPVTGPGDPNPDAVIQAGAAAVRAERLGTGNGRVYQISFQAEDGKGGSCTGAVKVGVPHSMGKGLTATDDGQVYSSTLSGNETGKVVGPAWQDVAARVR